jgi:hypothetical protein
MSRAARKRAADRRIQPYAWLGAGAVTLGMGAALMGGTAVAFADTGADSPSSANSASSEASKGTAPAKAGPRGEATKRRAAHSDRASAAADDSGQVTSSRRNRASAVADLNAEVAPAANAEVAPAANSEVAPAAATAPTATPRKSARAARDLIAQVAVPSLRTPPADPTPAVEDSPSTSAAPAAAVAPAAADPAPNMESWLPGGANPGVQIVPGARLAVALGEMKAAQALLNQQTWGSGNILAGIGSLGPQALLATAQLSLAIWSATNPGVQNFLASTARIPLVHQVAQIAVFNEMLVPTVAQISLGVAGALIPTLGWVGADVDATEALVTSARQNSKVYAVVPLRVKLGTQPMVNAKIAGGSNASLLLDTGASGLVTTRDSIGSAPLGPKIGEGNSCFSGGLCYHYETYNTTVDLGGGALTTAPVNLVTNNDEYPDGVEKFKEFFYYGDGILGVGANTAGPGPVPIPTAAMPGELHNGVLVFQNLLPFGLGGVMILGPNPLPTRASLPGAPDAFVKVSINGGAKQDGAAIIDSGGVFGTLNRSFMPGETSPDVPAGTKIDVYTADGATKLYSYTTQSGSSATPFIDSGLFNTGNAAYKQNPIYLNYGSTPYGIGSTDFSIW